MGLAGQKPLSTGQDRENRDKKPLTTVDAFLSYALQVVSLLICALILFLKSFLKSVIKHWPKVTWVGTNLSGQELPGETWRQELGQRPCRNTAYSHTSHDWLSLLSYKSQGHLSMHGIAHNGLTLLHQLAIKKCPRSMSTGKCDRGDFLIVISSFWVCLALHYVDKN